MSRVPFVLAASAALALLPAAFADDAPAPLKFAWPVPSKATVTERIWRGGMKWVEMYRVSLEKQGDDLKVRIEDKTIVEFGGKPPDDPAVAPYVARALPVSKLVPDLLVGTDGRVKDLPNLDAMIDAQCEILGKDVDESKRGALRAQMTSPEGRAAIRREATKNWQTWVGEWIDVAVAEGKDVETRHDVTDLDGRQREAPCIVHREPSSGGAARFTRVASLDGEATQPSLDAWIRAGTAKTGRSPPEGLFTGLALTNRQFVETDAATLRPKSAIREEAARVHCKDKDDMVAMIERHEFSFEWTADTAKKSSDK